MSSDLLTDSSAATYASYITVGKMIIKQGEVLSILVNLAKDAPARKKQSIASFEDKTV